MEKKLKDKTMSFRMEPEMYSDIEEEAKVNNMPLASFMRVVCKQWLAYHNKNNDVKHSVKLDIGGKKVDAVLTYDLKYYSIFNKIEDVKIKDKIANKPKTKSKIANS